MQRNGHAYAQAGEVLVWETLTPSNYPSYLSRSAKMSLSDVKSHGKHDSGIYFHLRRPKVELLDFLFLLSMGTLGFLWENANNFYPKSKFKNRRFMSSRTFFKLSNDISHVAIHSAKSQINCVTASVWSLHRQPQGGAGYRLLPTGKKFFENKKGRFGV